MSHEPNAAPRFSVAEHLRGKRILFIGATGFVGKVALSLLLRRFPDLDKVFVLVRAGHGETSEERFFKSIAASPVFQPLREVWGGGFDAFLREKAVPVGGDVSKPLVDFSDEDIAEVGRLDAIINCAGLVSFNPSLETGLRINTQGVRNTVELARRLHAAVVHVSTCYVTGTRDGVIWEDEPVQGYFPRKNDLPKSGFDVEGEIADCERLIAQIKERAEDRAHVSLFRERAIQRLEEEGRDADDDRTLRVAIQRERKLWVNDQLTDLGMERARYWGWTNTYTYTKSLGEQICAAQKDVPYCIVRPAIVESAVAYPVAGWNEGFTTTAPIAFATIKGHRHYPSGQNTTLDIIPVDFVASGLVLATAAVIAREHKEVYQLCSSDLNPFYMRRAVELLGLFKRRYFREREEGHSLINELQARLEPVAVSKETYNTRSAPMWKTLADRLKERLADARPRWGAPRMAAFADRLEQKIDRVKDIVRQTDDLFQLFMPFIHDHEYTFRADNLRALCARLPVEERHLLPWAPDAIDWRRWWLDVHMPGLEKWVFPSLEEEFAQKPRTVYTYRDLLEMFETTAKLHRGRTAMKMLPAHDSDEPARRYTYGDLQRLALRVAGGLTERGVAPGDRVMLLSEGRPEWGITYFGILKAGAVAVPVDAALSFDEVVNLLSTSRATAVLVSDKQLERIARALPDAPKRSAGEREEDVAQNVAQVANALVAAGIPAVLARFADVLGAAPLAETKMVRHAKGSELASLIFTSGTTGRPKGVMLSHRNFTSLLSRLSGIFDMDEHDGLLSVLPMHHTFEFTAGLLMPLARGAQIQYMEELSPENLQSALRRGEVTTLVGVPALWQLLHRRIKHQLGERGEWLVSAFEWLAERSRKARDEGPIDLNLGKLLFFPIHRRFGGRLRLLISGGSALASDTMKVFRGLGFNLYEGYGLTEAAPVLTVNRPGVRPAPGSVGQPLPGVEVRIDSPDESGVGEIVATGPNVMLGYFEDPTATGEVLKEGWLHTGDLGRFDEEKRLYIVGRRKDVIIGPSGENVYPDELEELYQDHALLKELSIVGLPEEGAGEVVACLCVPDYEKEELARELVRARLDEHFKKVSARLPLYKRVKVLHFWDRDLPRTATRKVKRKLVVEELQKLERLKSRVSEATQDGVGDAWLLDLVADLCGAPRERVTPSASLAALGFDSLMYAELGASLESAGVDLPDGIDLSGVGTVADVEALVRKHRKGAPKKAAPRKEAAPMGDGDELEIPAPLQKLGRALIRAVQRVSYDHVLATRVTGRAHIPATRSFIVAANHSSHLDMGLVKHALGEWGDRLIALAAKDYFFGGGAKKMFFENFTNLLPMDRSGSLRESLRLAGDVLRDGNVLLIFPEGTRSRSGVMADFKPSIGYLALQNRADVLPMFLEGTHEALPVGRSFPRPGDKVAAHIGPLVSYAQLAKATSGLKPGEANRLAARMIEEAVRKLDPSGSALAGWEARPATGRATLDAVPGAEPA
jgi:long-chain acyl-CoA synthetase